MGGPRTGAFGRRYGVQESGTTQQRGVLHLVFCRFPVTLQGIPQGWQQTESQIPAFTPLL